MRECGILRKNVNAAAFFSHLFENASFPSSLILVSSSLAYIDSYVVFYYFFLTRENCISNMLKGPANILAVITGACLEIVIIIITIIGI
jgi:hypothetical protein